MMCEMLMDGGKMNRFVNGIGGDPQPFHNMYEWVPLRLGHQVGYWSVISQCGA